MNHEAISFCDAEPDLGMSRPRLDVFNSRHHRHLRHPSPEGLAEVCPQSYSSFGHPNLQKLYVDFKINLTGLLNYTSFMC